MSVVELAATLATDLQHGLSQDERRLRLLICGPNVVLPPKRHCLVSVLLSLIGDVQLMLCGASTFVWFVNHIHRSTAAAGAGTILVVLVPVTGCLQVCQDRKVEKQMADERKKVKTAVIIDGQERSVPAIELVPGALVAVSGGSHKFVPADLRMLQSNDLMICNAALTGESYPLPVGVDPQSGNLYSSLNVAFHGCTFTSGLGVGVVFATGSNTFLSTMLFIQSPKPQIEKATFVGFCLTLGWWVASKALLPRL